MGSPNIILNKAEQRMKEMIENKTRIIEIPEFKDDQGETIKLFIRPMTTEEFQNIVNTGDEIDKMVATLVQRARKEDGTKYFTNIERKIIKRQFDIELLTTISKEINEDWETLFESDGVDRAKK